MALTGGWHCAGMCGAIATLSRSKSEIWLYQMGRGSSYLILGAGSGILGHKFYLTFNQNNNLIATLIILTLGGIIIFWGNLGEWLSKSLWKIIPKHSSYQRYFLLGFANGFLPCHLLYGFLTIAAASGSWAVGVLVLATLWMGSSPYLFTFSLIGRQLNQIKRRRPFIYKTIQVTLFLALTLNLIGHHI
jgi:hypothetical protein